jgi:hypothetical protein
LLEDPFREQVEQLAAFYGWLGYHTHDSRRSAPGFPDDVFVRGAELLFVEMKPDKGPQRVTAAVAAARPDWLQHRDLSDDQAVWLEALAVVSKRVGEAVELAEATFEVAGFAAVEVHIWRPRDFHTVIHPRLARGRVRQEPIDSLVPPPAAHDLGDPSGH